MPAFLRCCLRGELLHPDEEIHGDAVRPSYDLPWWNTKITFPPGGVFHVLSKSVKWYKWVAGGALPRKEPDVDTSKLSPEDVNRIKAQLEQARQLLVDRIAHAEAEVDWVTEQIREWEDIVYISAQLDNAKLLA